MLPGQRVLGNNRQFSVGNRDVAIRAADAVQPQVHRAEPRDAINEFDAEERAVLEPFFLRLVQAGRARDVIMRRQQKPAGRSPFRIPKRRDVRQTSPCQDGGQSSCGLQRVAADEAPGVGASPLGKSKRIPTS